MNLDVILRRFDDLADAPENISALRKLILASILRSTITSGEADSNCLKLREAHQIRLLDMSKKSDRKIAPAIWEATKEDIPFNLSGVPLFLFERLGNIASIEKGMSQIQKTVPGSFPLVVTAESRGSSDDYHFEGPAAIVPMVSSTGHGDASLKRLHYQEGQYAVGNILAVVQPICPDLIPARFIYEYLSAFKEELLVSRMVGTANVSLTLSQIRDVPIPLVTGRAMDRIEQMMSICDQLEVQLKDREVLQAELSRAALNHFSSDPTPDNLQFLFHPSFSISPPDLRKAILSLAIQGKLGTGNRLDTPAKEILCKSKMEKERLVSSKEIRPEAHIEPIDSKVPFSVPNSWAWSHLGDLCFPITSGSTPAQEEFSATTGMPYLKVYNIRNQKVDFTYKPQFVSASCHQKLLKRSRLFPGDVIMNIVGPPLGKVAVVPDAYSEWNCNQAIVFFRPLVRSIAPYIYLFLKEGSFLKDIHLIGTAGQDNISVTKCKNIPIPLPPLEEQIRIVTRVNQLLSLVDQIEAQRTSLCETSEKLLTAMVYRLSHTEPDLISGRNTSASTEIYVHPSVFLAAEVADRLHEHHTFGQTKLQKVLYIAEYYFQLPEVESTYVRYQRGPHDPKLISTVQQAMKGNNWFEVQPRKDGKGWHYPRLSDNQDYRELVKLQWPDKYREMRDFFDMLKNWSSEDCEVFATLFAAWNDLLIWGEDVSDERIIEEVFYNWHEDKQKISKVKWQDSLAWMKSKGFIPTGYGHATKQATQPRLGLDQG